MKLPPYTLQEAKDLCAEYQLVTGMPFEEGNNATIDMVIVTPYDQNSTNRFLMLYLMLNDANAALSLDYSGNQYDVIVVSGSATTTGLQQTSLCIWHKANEKCCIAEEHSSIALNA
jgi:hypothetical protein